MAGLLGSVFSAIDTQKRKLTDLLGNPVLSAQQILGNVNDKARNLNELTAQAAQEKDLYGPKSQQLASLLAEAYNPIGLTVYHGSPAKFSKFDPTKIGSGEGAQAYGYGHYVAESPSVAKDYQKHLAGATDPYTYTWNNQQYEGGVKGDPIAHALGLTYHQGKNVATRIAKQGIVDAKAGEPYALDMGGINYYEKMLDTAKQLNKKDIKAVQGSFYEIDLPDEQIAKMLDWDKPLSQQPKQVMDSLLANKEFGDDIAYMLRKNPDAKGQDVWEAIVDRFNSGASRSERNTVGAPTASKAMQESGIPGIRYLDQGSRGTGEGTSNFVVFPGNESLLTILKRNGGLLE